MSQRELIMQAALAVLNAVDRPSGMPLATRVRTARYEADEAPAINLAPSHEAVEPIGGRHSPAVKRALRLRIECWADHDAAADPLLDWVVVALLSHLPTAYPCLVAEDSIQWDFVDGGLARATVVFVVQYQTRAADPAAI